MFVRVELPKIKKDIDFQKILVALREELGLSQKEMASFFDVGLRTYQHWERGEFQPNGHVAYWLGEIHTLTHIDKYEA